MLPSTVIAYATPRAISNGVTLTNGQALVGPASYNPDQDGIAEFAKLVNERVADTIPAADLVAGDGSC
jgi:hypothetical protein